MGCLIWEGLFLPTLKSPPLLGKGRRTALSGRGAFSYRLKKGEVGCLIWEGLFLPTLKLLPKRSSRRNLSVLMHSMTLAVEVVTPPKRRATDDTLNPSTSAQVRK